MKVTVGGYDPITGDYMASAIELEPEEYNLFVIHHEQQAVLARNEGNELLAQRHEKQARLFKSCKAKALQ